MRKRFVPVLACLLILAQSAAAQENNYWRGEDEIIYQIFTRSFRDSNRDHIGDLRGIRQALPYLQQLGVTSLLLTPINPSPFYHNYFGTGFEGVDREYGTTADLNLLIKAVHARRMKLYIDEEIQYLAEGHPWWQQSQNNPRSKYSHYLIYHGPNNTKPESAVYGITVTEMYNGEKVGLTTLNLHNPEVRAYFQKLFADLTRAGVDGFRIDHMMDDLDGKGILKNLFAEFWAPIFASARAVNPRVQLLAEQADWGGGIDYLTRGNADFVFAFPLQRAVATMNRDSIAKTITQMVAQNPAGKGQILFIENHDLTRFATLVQDDRRKEMIGAALALLLKGTPLIYYGQELGMRGRRQEGFTSDGNDIPDREAFEWTRKVESPIAATWYQGSATWWTNRFARDDDGVSLEEEKTDTASLLSYYKQLIATRRGSPEFTRGSQRVIDAGDANVLAVERAYNGRSAFLLVNLQDKAATVNVAGNEGLELKPYEVRILKAVTSK